jgi:hypothetical protein
VDGVECPNADAVLFNKKCKQPSEQTEADLP